MNKVTLGDISIPKSSNIMQKDLENNNGAYPIYGASGIIKNIDFYKFETEYIAIVKDGAGVGRVMKLPAKSSIIGTMQGIIPNEKIDIDYLCFFLKAKKLEHYYTGATIPHIYYKDYKKEEIELIDINEQKKRAGLLNDIEKTIKIKQQQLKELENLAKNQFIKMFGDPIANDRNFCYKEIGEIAEIITGTTPDTTDESNWNGNINWITPAEIDSETFFIFDTKRKITEKGKKSKSLILMPEGTVIFSTRAPIGKTAIAGAQMCCNQGFKNCVCKNDINNIYLFCVLRYNTEYFNSLGTGATFKELSKRVFEKVKIAVPPIELQNKFAELVKYINKQQEICRKIIEKLNELKESKMQEFFGGEIDE